MHPWHIYKHWCLYISCIYICYEGFLAYIRASQSHAWPSHVTHMIDKYGGLHTPRLQQCHEYEWVISHLWLSHITRITQKYGGLNTRRLEPCHEFEWVTSHACKWVMSHVSQTNMGDSTHLRHARPCQSGFSGYIKGALHSIKRALYSCIRALHLRVLWVCQKSSIFCQKSPIIYQKSPIIIHKSITFMWQTSYILASLLCNTHLSLGTSKEPYIWPKEPFI